MIINWIWKSATLSMFTKKNKLSTKTKCTRTPRTQSGWTGHVLLLLHCYSSLLHQPALFGSQWVKHMERPLPTRLRHHLGRADGVSPSAVWKHWHGRNFPHAPCFCPGGSGSSGTTSYFKPTWRFTGSNVKSWCACAPSRRPRRQEEVPTKTWSFCNSDT